VILLLARLGLRASEVAGLRFADIDWRNGRLAVSGKGRRQDWLPLPQDIGTAILAYLRHGRPPLQAPEVFTSGVAPIRPLTRAAVTHIVRGALCRAGLKAPVNGAHVLRHSAATAMLRQGVSLAGVGAVLRHRSPRTTAHYAKVDFGLLSELAQPWPGALSC
jgi:integrase/recombinase XerD